MTKPESVIESMSLEQAVRWVISKGEDPDDYAYLWAALLDDDQLERSLRIYQDLKLGGHFKEHPDGWVTLDALISETLNRRYGVETTFSRVVRDDRSVAIQKTLEPTSRSAFDPSAAAVEGRQAAGNRFRSDRCRTSSRKPPTRRPVKLPNGGCSCREDRHVCRNDRLYACVEKKTTRFAIFVYT